MSDSDARANVDGVGVGLPPAADGASHEGSLTDHEIEAGTEEPDSTQDEGSSSDEEDAPTEDDNDPTEDEDDLSTMADDADSDSGNIENVDEGDVGMGGFQIEGIGGDGGFDVQRLSSQAMAYSELTGYGAVIDEVDGAMNDGRQKNYKGSVMGRQNIQRNFTGAYERLMSQYFNGDQSSYTRTQFCRRFRVSPEIFQLVYGSIVGKGEFRSPLSRNAAGKQVIHPLVRTTAVFRVLAYGDTYEREDENLQIGESTLDSALQSFCHHVVLTFGDHYLNRPPNNEERKVILRHNASRGFPGLFASWDCKHFVWDMCPVHLQGQHRGHHQGGKNTVILEAIADGSCYIWYANFGNPGSLNDLNVLDKSPIVGDILQGRFDLKTEPYTINGNVRDWIYFLVDGIYPNWAIFAKTIPDAARMDERRAFYSSRQEAVRKDIERAFGILVKKFQILSRPLRIRNMHTIRSLLKTCIILHNMTCAERSGITEAVLTELDHGNYLEDQLGEQEVVTLFGQIVAQNNDLNIVETARIANFMEFNHNMSDPQKHFALQNDLVQHNGRPI
jgi:hypothetical protein